MNLSRIPIIVWFAVPTVLILVVGVWFFSKSAGGDMKQGDDLSLVPVSTPVEGTIEYKIVARNHISAGTAGSNYNSNPPSSGMHWPSPAKNGTYDSPLPDEQAIHNLEHGYVWISYRTNRNNEATDSAPKAGLSDDDVNKLKEIVKSDNWKIIMTPRDGDDSAIALVSWGRVLNLDHLDEAKVRDFVKTYRNRGPEKTPD